MKKYNVPIISINMFEKEDVVTEASTQWVGGLNTMSEDNRRAVQLDDMKKVIGMVF